MALTVEILKQNAALNGLSDEQLTAIATMSTNDENNVINTRIGALHGQYDSDILAITGIKKNEGEKSYAYAKRVLESYKTKLSASEGLTNEINQLKADKAALEQQIANSTGDAVLKQKLQDTETRLAQLQTQYDEAKAVYAKDKQSYEDKIKAIHVDNFFEQAISGLTFKDGISDTLKRLAIADAKAQVLAKGTPEFVEENGVKSLQFRDKAGNLLNNPANNLKPYTVSELLQGVDSLKDILGTPQSGGGTGPNKNTGNNDTFTVASLASAKTQVEADDMIAKYLMSLGLTRDSNEFATKSFELRKQANIDKLPLR